MNEKLLEKNLINKITKLGGLALKFIPDFWVGAPDRLILLPGGRTYWVELKSTGGLLRKLQQLRKRHLEKLGFKVYVIDDKKSLNDFISEVQEYEF